MIMHCYLLGIIQGRKTPANCLFDAQFRSIVLCGVVPCFQLG